MTLLTLHCTHLHITAEQGFASFILPSTAQPALPADEERILDTPGFRKTLKPGYATVSIRRPVQCHRLCLSNRKYRSWSRSRAWLLKR